MNTPPKDQFIIAFIRDFNNTDTVLSHADALSSILKKKVILLFIVGDKSEPDTFKSAEKYLISIKSQNSFIFSYRVLKGNIQTIIGSLSDTMGAVCIVTSLKYSENKLYKIRKVFNLFSESKIAYIIAKCPLTHIHSLKKIAFGIDFEKSSKEKVLWASYFGRFHQSEINILHFQYRDAFLRKKLQNNHLFVKKILSGFQVLFSFHLLQHNYKSLDIEAYKQAVLYQAGLYISICSKSTNWFQLWRGRTEEQLLYKSNNIPILFLNPRNDLYILCD